MILTVSVLCAVAAVLAGLRWARVAQREHYLAPAATRFAIRWWMRGPVNLILLSVAVAGVILTTIDPIWGLLAPLAQIGPIGLGLRGRTSPLAWTARLRRVVVVAGGLAMVIFASGAIWEVPWLAPAGLVVLPAIVDLALLILAPIERKLGDKWVERAEKRVRVSGATVVAITGSYGKTTTKEYLTHLIMGTLRTVPSPASFNNRMGLARAVNEHLVPGTEVFVAEMGTYGPGEIADMVRWLRPSVSAVVSVGPVHLERFKTEENIVAAKAEILDGARTAVIGIDHPLLAALARDRGATQEVITVSSNGAESRISTDGDRLRVDGAVLAEIPTDVFALNLGVAVGLAMALGVSPGVMAGRIDGLPRSEHRQSVSTSDLGFSIIDDTFNSNPDGARSALQTLARLGEGGRTAVVTPGMVELGPIQYAENREFGHAAGMVADDLLIVGDTNRAALLDGSASGTASVTVVASRQQAVAWVRGHLGSGDAVLYENDLPDHYP
jgi:UDP-N-acetylmuramoyl-tripeptide--D-alanyl-D-alanine ligase